MDAVADIVRKLKKMKGVKAIFLFGSYARGTQKPLSDIDICVVTERKISDRLKGTIASNSTPVIHIALFWDMPSAVRYSALKESKSLYVKDEQFLHDAKVATMSEYLDFKHLIDRAIARAKA